MPIGSWLKSRRAEHPVRHASTYAIGPNSDVGRYNLQQCVRAKKHQERADRTLGVLLDQRGEPMIAMWLAHEPDEDPGLDELARQMRLRLPGFSSLRPPAAKRRKSRKRRHRRWMRQLQQGETGFNS